MNTIETSDAERTSFVEQLRLEGRRDALLDLVRIVAPGRLDDLSRLTDPDELQKAVAALLQK